MMVLPILLMILLAQLAITVGWPDRWMEQQIQLKSQLGGKEWENQWYGIRCQQYPTDLQIYQQLIWEVKPDIFIETGTFCGGNSLYVATLLEMINPKAKVLTIDIDASNWKKTQAELKLEGKDRLLQRIHFFEGSSTDPSIVAKIKEHINKHDKVMVLLDSLHTADHVFGELKAYAPLVTVNSYLIVNDMQWVHPAIATAEFLKTTDEFEVDAAVDKFYLSCAHGGFLKRVKNGVEAKVQEK
jgi:cephalosporin hydroxylase